VRSWLANVADGAAVVLFAAVGRASHAEGVTGPGVAEVAWPFLVGAAAGTLAGRTWRRPSALSSGAYVWVGALIGGMLLRALTGGGVQVSFVVVTAVVLAVLVLGWRLLYGLVRSRRLPTPSVDAPPG
jgi:hypothetical protein